MKPLILATTLLASWGMAACSHATSTPEALAKAVQAAFDKGDFDAARKLADLDDAPADLHFYFFENVRECSTESTCSVSASPATDEDRAQLQETAKQLNAQAPAVDGMITVTTKAKDGSSSGKMTMPYAKVGDGYRIVTIRYSESERAALRAKSDKALVDEFFAQGIRDSSGELRTDWASAATALPADGGAPGKAFVAQTRAMSAAVDAKDPDAAMNSGGQMASIVHRDKDFDGKPIPLVERQRKLHVQSLRMLRDVKVNGGYQLGDDVVLLIEARNGIGWIERGPILLSRDGEYWSKAGDNLVSYPATP